MVSRKPRQGAGRRSAAKSKKPSTRRAKAPQKANQRKPALATAAAGRRGTGDEEE